LLAISTSIHSLVFFSQRHIASKLAPTEFKRRTKSELRAPLSVLARRLVVLAGRRPARWWRKRTHASYQPRIEDKLERRKRASAMHILAIETSANVGAVCVLHDGVATSEIVRDEVKLSAWVVPAIDRLQIGGD
jgi:hypothetical protein